MFAGSLHKPSERTLRPMDAYYSAMMQVITVLLLVVLIQSSAAALVLTKWLSGWVSDEDGEVLLWKGRLLWKLLFRGGVFLSVLFTYFLPTVTSVIAYAVSIDNLTSGRAGPGINMIHRVAYTGGSGPPIVKGTTAGDAAAVSVCLMVMIFLVLAISTLQFSLQRKEVAEQHRPTARRWIPQ
jgi:hypothetical protein